MTLARRCVAVAAALAAALMAGCEPVGYYFRPVDHQAGLTPDGTAEQALYTIGAEGGSPANVMLTARGHRLKGPTAEPDGEAPAGDAILVGVNIENATASPVTFDADKCYLVDDEGGRTSPAKVYATEQGPTRFTVPPGGKMALSLLFHLDSPDALGRVGSFRFGWTAGLAGQSQQFVTKFVRSREPTVYYEDYYYGPPGYYYGYPYGYYSYPYYWGFGYRYYDPFPYYLYQHHPRRWRRHHR